MITLADVEAARARIRGAIYESPCVESIPLSQLTGAHIYCKLDYLQRTGSFKERGARNALLQLAPEPRARGVIAASAGNHAQGLAYHGGLLGIPVTVVMPTFAPLIERGLLRFMYAKDEVVILLVTYALFLILEDTIKLVWGVDPYFIAEPYGLLGSFEVGTLSYPTYNLILVGLALVSGIVLAWLLNNTRTGKLLRAVIHDPEVSAAMGVNVHS